MFNDDTERQGAQQDESSNVSRDSHGSRGVDAETLAKRDLGTVGGGKIPGGDTDKSEADGEQHESVKNSSNETSPAAINTTGKQAHSRHPSQPQTAMGDRDASKSRPGEEIADPMSSRAPDKINQQ